MLAQSPEPKVHDKVLDDNPDRIEIWKCWFLRRGENQNTRRKTKNWNLEMLVLEERGKSEYPEKNLSEKGREQTTNSTHM